MGEDQKVAFAICRPYKVDIALCGQLGDERVRGGQCLRVLPSPGPPPARPPRPEQQPAEALLFRHRRDLSVGGRSLGAEEAVGGVDGGDGGGGGGGGGEAGTRQAGHPPPGGRR